MSAADARAVASVVAVLSAIRVVAPERLSAKALLSLECCTLLVGVGCARRAFATFKEGLVADGGNTTTAVLVEAGVTSAIAVAVLDAVGSFNRAATATCKVLTCRR